MQKSKDRLKEEIKALIAKGNAALNAGQNKQKTTAYLYVIFSLIAFSGFGIFAIGPTITTISDLNKQLEENKKALKQLEEKNAALKSLSAELIEIEKDLYLIDKAIPSTSEIATFTRQLEQLTINNGLSVQKIDTGLVEIFPAKNVNSPIFSYTFSIAVAGSEANINRFVSDLINMERIISIERLTTGNLTTDTKSASIIGKVYFYKEGGTL